MKMAQAPPEMKVLSETGVTMIQESFLDDDKQAMDADTALMNSTRIMSETAAMLSSPPGNASCWMTSARRRTA